MQGPSGKRPKFELEQAASPSVPPESGAEDTKSFNTLVGEGIRRARQQLGWTQAVLAEAAGLSPNYIARLERGELGPSFFVANRICGALNIDLDALVASPGMGLKRSTTKRRVAG